MEDNPIRSGSSLQPQIGQCVIVEARASSLFFVGEGKDLPVFKAQEICDYFKFREFRKLVYSDVSPSILTSRRARTWAWYHSAGRQFRHKSIKNCGGKRGLLWKCVTLTFYYALSSLITKRSSAKPIFIVNFTCQWIMQPCRTSRTPSRPLNWSYPRANRAYSNFDSNTICLKET